MADLSDTVVVVSGLPRSGTSLMMQMLEAGGVPPFADFERVADEDNPKGYYELEAIKKVKENPTLLDGAEGKVVKAIHMLLMDLPGNHKYKILFMRRNLDEVLTSQRKMLDRSGKKGAAIPEAALKKVFESQLAKVDAWTASQENIEVLNVEHRALLTDPAPVVEQINAFLGGTLDTEKMTATVDPTLYRNKA